MNPLNEQYGPGYESGQIRIAFVPGNVNLNRVLSGGIILGQSKAAKNYGIRKSTKQTDWSGQFHRFGVTWGPGEPFITETFAVFYIISAF